MFSTLSNFTYARAQPLTQRTNNYLNKSKNKNQIGNSLGKTIGVFKKQNMKPICESDTLRTFTRSNSDYQIGPCTFSKTLSSFYNQSQQTKKNLHQPITIQLLNEKILRLTQRVQSNQQQIFYLKSTKDNKLIPGLNIADLKQLIEDHRLQGQRNNNYASQIKQLKQNIINIRQQINKSVKKRQFEHQMQNINLRLRDIKGDLVLSTNQIVYQMVQKTKTRKNNQTFILHQDVKKQIIQIQDYCQQIQQKLLKEITNLKVKFQYQYENNNPVQYLKSNSIFKSLPIKFIIQQRIKKIGLKGKQQNQQYKIAQTIYCIDNQGFLLDQNFHYLLDSNNKQIKLTNKEIKMLQNINILK